MCYATFWQRFAAMWIDVFALLPLMLFREGIQSTSRGAAIWLVVPMEVTYCAYVIYCHGRFGQTIGKYAVGIRVVLMTGKPIGWREAWLRSSVDVAFSVLGAVSSLIALAAITDAQYYGVGWMQRARNLSALEPTWLAWSATATQIWIWSEVVVMLFNKQRRALHDFIAGTVVISEKRVFPVATEV